jgi:glycosyltransferase involved in cell wall biosynthesis
MSAQVTIGVPVFRGERFLGEAVDSILAQTHRDWQVVFSVDGPDPECEQMCEQYLRDPRFSLSVQPERLGWVRNIDWLQQQADSEFWYYHQQDDLVEPTFLDVLIDEARRWPDAAVVYCDMDGFGARDLRFARPSLVGSPVARQLSMLTDQFAGVAFRGLTRVTAIRDTGGGMVRNDAGDFAADTVWIATMATWGDLIRVPTTLYHKRYHDENVHSVWMAWNRNQRVEAWIVHCHDLLEVSTRVPAQRSERWLLWLATVIRLTTSRATPYLPWAELTDGDRVAMTDDLLDRIRLLGRIDLPDLLDTTWPDIRRRSIEFAIAPASHVVAASRAAT